MTTIAIIPARGGSKGIPRKSLRPIAGKPMIYYAITAAKNAAGVNRVVVTTDDDEIAMLAERFGASIIKREPSLATDDVPLDPVIISAVATAQSTYGEIYSHIITVQPTSPLVQSSDIEEALALLNKNNSADTVLSVVDDRHLRWTLDNGRPVPAYTARVNRQLIPPTYRETGAVIACTAKQLTRGTRIGQNIILLEIPPERSVDIDSVPDLFLCEHLLQQKKIAFVVIGYPEVGLGHAYRTVMLANELVHHKLHFFCERRSELAARYISSFNYPVKLSESLIADLAEFQPDLVINDILDTDENYIERLHALGSRVANFEDLGPGHRKADLVINALYGEGDHPLPHVRNGVNYFCLRDEFLYSAPSQLHERVRRVLVTFGGVDEGNLTARVVDLIAPWCADNGIYIDVVLGPGYAHHEILEQVIGKHPSSHVSVTRTTRRISDHMSKADLAITSGGRTVLELASLEVPTIVICQNFRETTHLYAADENGVANLGLHSDVSDSQILEAFTDIATNPEKRRAMQEKAKRLNLRQGKKRVIGEILALLEG